MSIQDLLNQATSTITATAAAIAAEAEAARVAALRYGTLLGDAVHLRLPEMAASFARGLVIQVWVRPGSLQDATIVELGQTTTLGKIALVCRQDAVELQWHDSAGTLRTARKAGMVTAGVWSHVSVALGPNGVCFYRDGAALGVDTPQLLPTTPLPLEAPRAYNYIGNGNGNGAAVFTGAVADLRLWNRSQNRDLLVARSGRVQRGDEAGLCGWWTLEGAAGGSDGSPFARHATLVGGAYKAGASTFNQQPQRDVKALDFGAGVGKVDIGGFALTRAGFTWQAKIRVRDLQRATRLLTLRGAQSLEITLKDGALTCSSAGAVLKVYGVVTANTWVGLAVRQGVDGTLTAFVDGVKVGTPVAATPLPAGNYTATVGEQLDGQLAELRLWSRGLTGAELLDTAGRRIHGWAPGLIGCWRMDDEWTSGDRPGLTATIHDGGNYSTVGQALAIGSYDHGALTIGNDRLSSLRVPFGLKVTLYEHGGFTGQTWVHTADGSLVANNDLTSGVVVEALPGLLNVNPAGPATVVTGAAPADRIGLSFGPAPKVAPPRVAGLGGAQTLMPPGVGQIGASGCSLQLWVRPEQLADATFLKLAETLTPAQLATLVLNKQPKPRLQSITLASTASGGLAVGYADTLYLQAPRVESVFTARTWAHITVTIAPNGVVCIYRDGTLVAREEHDALFPGTLNTVKLGAGFNGCLSELRVWSRALTAHEVEHNWRRRVSSAVGLAGRWALAGDLTGTPGSATGATPIWREAPALRLTDGPPAQAATVTAQASLLADQTGKGRKPELVVDLTAINAAGQPLVGVELTVVLDGDVSLWRGSTTGQNIQLTAKTFKITTGARGRVRLAMVADSLLAPIFSVRHALMGEGEWALVTPDQVIHQALASLTAQEITAGRRATPSTRAGTTGLVKTDGDKLARVLRGMLGAAAAFSFEQQSTAALAFGDDEAAPEGLALVPAPGGNFHLGPDVLLVRRLGAAPLPGGEPDGAAGPQSFGILDDVCSFVTRTAAAVVTSAVETVEGVGSGIAAVGKAVVQSITADINMVIEGVQVAVKAVMTTVAEVVAAALQVFTAIKQTVAGVLNYLAELFDWGDIRETADLLLTELQRSLGIMKTKTVGVFTTVKGAIHTAESQVLLALGGKALPASAAESRTQSQQAGPPQSSPALDFLLAMLPDDLEETIKDFLAIFDPVATVLSSALGRLGTLGTGLATEWNGPDIQAALADPRRLLDSDPGDWLALARILVKVIANTIVLAIDFARDLGVALLESFERFLALHLQIPVLTAFVETNILGGRTLTVGRLLCLIPAIPVTVVYKAVTGRKTGPAALAGPQTFGYNEEWAARAMIMRGASVVMSGIGAVFDGIDAFSPAPPGTKTSAKAWALWTADGFRSLFEAGFLFYDEVTDETSTAENWKFVVDLGAWVTGFIGWICTGITLKSPTAAVAEKAANYCGIASDGLGAVSGIIDLCITGADDGKLAGDVLVSSLDLASSLGELIAGIGNAIPQDSVDPASQGGRIAAILGGHALGVGAAATAFGVIAYRNDG